MDCDHLHPVPVFAPVVRDVGTELGMEPSWAAVWFGILFVMNIQINFLLPQFWTGVLLAQIGCAQKHNIAGDIHLGAAVYCAAGHWNVAGYILLSDRTVAAANSLPRLVVTSHFERTPA